MDEEIAAPESTAVVNPAPFVINGTDRAGLIVVVTTFCLVSVWVLFVIRAYIRLKINGPWKLDDTFVAIATVLSTVRSATVYIQVSRGYGKSVDLLQPGAQADIGKALFGDLILFFVALFFSKCAVLLLCQRMTPKQEHWIAIGAIFILTILWVLSSILLVSVKCSPSKALDAEQCSNLPARWRAICVFDIVTEFSIFACAIYLVHGLHMSWVTKALVIVAFAIRLPTTIFSGVHLHSMLIQISSSNPSYAGAVTAIWRQFELDFAIVACTLSSLGAFLKPFDKELGPSRSGSNPIGSDRGFPMNSMRSANDSRRGVEPSSKASLQLPILRPDPNTNTATVMSMEAPSDRLSVESNDSKKGIIMKKQWIVDHSSRKNSASSLGG